jgi:poly(A) polymerase
VTERDFAVEVVRKLRDAGHLALWAGGCVRDELLGLVPADYDVATDARPEAVRCLFRRTVAVGQFFGVVEVIGPRSDDGFSRSGRDHRLTISPTAGVPTRSSRPRARTAAARFTINGMFLDPTSCELIDHVGGQDDLKRRVVRAIGDARLRFEEDKLRMLRAVRIATQQAADQP